MRVIALTLLAVLAGSGLARAENADIVEQNGVLIFYPPGTAAEAAAAEEAAKNQPVVINKYANQQATVVVAGGGPVGWPYARGYDPRVFQGFPCFCRMYSGPLWPY